MNPQAKFEVVEVNPDELSSVVAWFARHHYGGDGAAAHLHFDDHFTGGTTYLARNRELIAGFITLRWVSENEEFRQNGVPFIHHLEVFDPYKRRGLGSLLLQTVERRVAKVAKAVGLCVGIFDAYGPALRLYAKRGYLPDGRGVCDDHVPVRRGDEHVIDHNLVMWLAKDLSGEGA